MNIYHKVIETVSKLYS